MAPTNLAVMRIVLAASALWVILSRHDLPSLLSYPDAFWQGVTPERRLRYFLLFRHGSEEVLWIALHAALILTILGILTRWSALLSGLLLYHFAPLESLFRGADPYLLGLTTPCVGLILVAASASGGDFLRKRRGEDGWINWQHRWPVATAEFLLCAMYFFAGYSKLFASGLGWLRPQNIRNYILGIDQLLEMTQRPSLGLWIADHPAACLALAVGGVAFELLFPLVLFSSRARAVLVPLAVVFHVLNAIIFHIHFQSIGLLLIFVDWHALLTNRRMKA